MAGSDYLFPDQAAQIKRELQALGIKSTTKSQSKFGANYGVRTLSFVDPTTGTTVSITDMSQWGPILRRLKRAPKK
jgi:hypothetical protein